MQSQEFWLFQRNTQLSNFNWASEQQNSNEQKIRQNEVSLVIRPVLNWNGLGYSPECYGSWKCRSENSLLRPTSTRQVLSHIRGQLIWAVNTQRVWVFFSFPGVWVFDTPSGSEFFGVWIFYTPSRSDFFGVWVFYTTGFSGIWGLSSQRLSFRDTRVAKIL